MLLSGSCWTSPIDATTGPGAEPPESTVSVPVRPPSGRIPASAARSVDLPDPDAPISTTSSPGATESETSDSAAAERPG